MRVTIGIRLIPSLGLSLCCVPLLMFVVLVPGDTTAKRAQHPMMHHMAGNRTGDTAANAADRVGRRVPTEAQTRGKRERE